MAASSSPEKRAQELLKLYGTKASAARQLLDEGFTVSQISKAVPMSYSQVHSINRARGEPEPAKAKPIKAAPTKKTTQQILESQATIDPRFRTVQTRNADRRKLAEAQRIIKAVPRIGKLRTPGLPSDRAVGACANCSYDIVVRRLPTGYTLVHVNTTAEDYLKTVQFCQAVPESLIA